MYISLINKTTENQGSHTAIISGGEPFTMPLFLYRDFLPVLAGEDHLVVVDHDPAEQFPDIDLIKGDQQSRLTCKK